MMVRPTRLPLPALCMLILAGIDFNIASLADTPEPANIVVKDFMFMPTQLTVKAGSTVTWTNKDNEPHTVISDTGLFKSGGMDTDESFKFRFEQPGTYHFTCSIHPRMVGTIIVQ